MHKVILASGSPRRKQLMELAELDFEVIVTDVDETPPANMHGALVPEYLAQKKAAAIAGKYPESIVVAADTIVLLDDDILGKPTDNKHAIEILKKLSGRMHEVVTGVCICNGDKKHCFSTTTQVFFRKLTEEQIVHYVQKYLPFDKAGAYAIQEWIGMIGIEKINGDYYNVMGLPIGEVAKYLTNETRN